MSIMRYEIYGQYGYDADAEPNPEGEWVRYEDHLTAMRRALAPSLAFTTVSYWAHINRANSTSLTLAMRRWHVKVGRALRLKDGLRRLP